MIPQRFISHDARTDTSWEELGLGAPTIIGLARLCSNSLAAGQCDDEELSLEARAILCAAAERGVLEIKCTNNAFDAVDRFLAVHVEIDSDTALAFKNKKEPARTVRFLDAFRELCQAGLVFHQIYREFSLTTKGFEVARSVPRESVAEALAFGVEVTHGEW